MSRYNDPEYDILLTYNDGAHYDYAYRLGLAAAKKWNSKVTDAQLINAIKKGRTEGYSKKTHELTWNIYQDYFRNSDEREYAVNKFIEHIKNTAFKSIGKRQLKAIYGNISDEKLLKNVVDAIMSGDMTDDIYPIENIDYGFEEVITSRLKALGAKNRERALKKKIAIKKKQYAKKQTTKRTTRRS